MMSIKSKNSIIKMMILLMLLNVFYSCDSNNELNSTKIVNEDFIVEQQNLFFLKELNYEKYIVSDSLVINQHNSALQDTLRYIKRKSNLDEYFYLYKTRNKVFLVSCVIMSEKFNVNENISIGMSKNEFNKVFKIDQLKFNSIIISDTESNNYWTFLFDNNRLKSVQYKGYLD